MALTKQTAIDQITVTEDGTILFRECTQILEDGVQLSRSYHRSSLIPCQNIEKIPEIVRKICSVVWTTEVIKKHQLKE